MSEAMIRRPYTTIKPVPVGVGEINTDVQNYIAVALKPQIDAAKADVLAEVKKQGDAAKQIAIIGGIVAGLAGVGIGVLVAKRVL